MDESQLKENIQEKERNERLRMIATSLYNEERKTLSPEEIYNKETLEVTLLESYKKNEASDIINFVRCLCISDYKFYADSPYDYSIENKYDPKFMNKFSSTDIHNYKYIDADLTEELFGDENRAALKKRGID